MKKLLIFLVVLLTGCSSELRYQSKTEFDAIFNNGGNRYEVYIKQGNRLIKRRLPSSTKLTYNIFTDVAPNEKGWYEYKYYWNSWSGTESGGEVNIHIHSVDSLISGTYDKGKFGTNKILRID